MKLLTFGSTAYLFRLVMVTAVMAAISNFAPAQWIKQEVETDAAFRGLSVVNANVVWASGTKGTFIRTVDGGKHWSVGTVAGAEALDFRDVEAFDANTAYLMAAGPGEASRIYQTTDGGVSWTLQFKNTEPKAFFDAMAFWDARHGMVLSDPVDGRFLLLRTDDAGRTWVPLPATQRPQAQEGAAAFAASGTCLIVQGKSDIWIATGGTTARVFHSLDSGKTWTVAETYVRMGSASTGIFSLAFAEDRKRGVAVGGDYQDPNKIESNFAWSEDGGTKWLAFKNATVASNGGPVIEIKTDRPQGFRSGVAYVPGTNGKTWVTVGTNGSDISVDGGQHWQPLDGENYNSVAFADKQTGWSVGPKGRVAKYSLRQQH